MGKSSTVGKKASQAVDWGGERAVEPLLPLPFSWLPLCLLRSPILFFFLSYYPSVEPGPRLDNLNQIHQLQYHFSQIYKQEHSMTFWRYKGWGIKPPHIELLWCSPPAPPPQNPVSPGVCISSLFLHNHLCTYQGIKKSIDGKIKIINLLITNPFILIEYTTDYQSYRLTTLKGYVQLHRPPSF